MNRLKRTYIIKYKVFRSGNILIEESTIKAKAYTELDAKFNLPNYVQKKHPNMYRIEIVSCDEQHDVIDFFNNIFK